jgi:hypothetical protein
MVKMLVWEETQDLEEGQIKHFSHVIGRRLSLSCPLRAVEGPLMPWKPSPGTKLASLSCVVTHPMYSRSVALE